MESRYLLLIAITVLTEVAVIITFVRMAKGIEKGFSNVDKKSNKTKKDSSFLNYILRSELVFKKFLSSTIKSIF